LTDNCNLKIGASMKNEMSQKRQWVEIALELDQHLQDPLANFLVELGAEGVIIDEDIIDPLTGTIKPDRQNLKLMRAYLEQNSHYCEKSRP